MKYYAISDIHACLQELEAVMKKVDLSDGNRIVFCGDYIDYGNDSCRVLEYIHGLQQKYGDKTVIVLKGNHEVSFLEWIDSYSKSNTVKMPEFLPSGTWFIEDAEDGFKTYRTFVTDKDLMAIKTIAKHKSAYEINRLAVTKLLEHNADIISWMRTMKLFHETDDVIYVHAGVDEEAGAEWKYGTEESIFTQKYPADTGAFIKTIVAGHIGSGTVCGKKEYHDVYHDGESHYYIDGSVYDGGQLNLLVYDDKKKIFASLI